MRWCNIFMLGIVGMGAAVVLMVLGSHGALHGWLGWSVIGLGVGGFVATFIGMIGVLTGCRYVFSRHVESVDTGGNANSGNH